MSETTEATSSTETPDRTDDGADNAASEAAETPVAGAEATTAAAPEAVDAQAAPKVSTDEATDDVLDPTTDVPAPAVTAGEPVTAETTMPRQEAEEAATEAEVGADAAAEEPGEAPETPEEAVTAAPAEASTEEPAAEPAADSEAAAQTPVEEPVEETATEAVAEGEAPAEAAAPTAAAAVAGDDAPGAAEAPTGDAAAPADETPETEAKAEAPATDAAEAKADGGDKKAAEPAEPQTGKTAEGEDVAEDDPRVQELLAAMKTGSSVEGKVFGWNQGGFHVLINGILAFCPRSEIDLGNPKSPKKYVEKKYPFRIIDHRPQGNRFTVSRKGILEERQAKDQAATREKLAPGIEMQGRVTSLTGFGAFVDLGGGIEGMIHVSELSHLSVNHPKEVVKSGQKVKVKVLKIENDGNRISLSKRALEDNPWHTFAEKYPRGHAFSGKITSKTDFGLFVEVEPGMEGLVHVSALPPGQTLESDEYQPGAELSGWIKDVEVKRQRISLSLKEVPTSDPWKGIDERFSEGDTVQGKVEEVAPFGVFINLEPGLTGLLPNSEMNLPRGTQPARVYSPGTEVELQIGRIEAKRKRLTLVPEGSKIEGSRSDYKNYVKKAKEESGSGLGAMAAAFAKLKDDD